MMNRSRILIVEDEAIVSLDLEQRLSSLGYDVVAIARNAKEALARAGELQPDVVLMDIRLNGSDGIEAAGRMQELHRLPVIFLTAYADDETLRRAQLTHPLGYLVKPFDERELHAAIQVSLDRKRLEAELRERGERLRQLSSVVEQTADHVMITRKDGAIEYTNPAFEALTGYSSREVRSKQPSIFRSGVHEPEFYRHLWETILEGGVFRGTLCNRKKNGDLFWEEKTITPLRSSDGEITHFVSTAKDVSENRALQERLHQAERDRLRHLRESQTQLMQAEKLAALGRLVASINHEINNPLQSIEAFLALLHDGLLANADRVKLLHYLEIVTGEIRRISATVRRLHEYYRPSQESLHSVDLNKLVEGTLELCSQRLLESRVRADVDLAEDLPQIRGFGDHLKQVLMNLVLNAIDAMPEGGELALRTRRDRLGAEADGNQRTAVRIEVADTGIGISADDQRQVFEPFFTTKRHGSGLGLFVCTGLVEAHGGEIGLDSEIGRGTTFFIRLPAWGG